MSTTASPITYFSGMSNYSQDLQNVIYREVQIASLPITQLQNNVSTLTNQSSELQTLSGKFSSLQSAISSLSSAAGQTLAATSSNSSAVTASVSDGAVAASYAVEVDNLGSYSDALSLDTTLPKVTDPTAQSITSSQTFTLTVNGKQTTVHSSGTSLNALAQAVNNVNAGVQATVIDVGSGTSHDYRLSLQSTQYGAFTMQLNDGSTDLLSTTATGQPVQYSINGKQLSGGSRTVGLTQGLTLNLSATNVGAPATITVAANTGGIAQALQSFVTAYNGAVDELNQNRGQAGGALTGQGIVSSLAGMLESVAGYSNGTSGISSLYSLGVSFGDTSGHLSFDAATFNAAVASQPDALSTFLGSATGGGFLQTATDTLNGIEDPTNGILPQTLTATIAEVTSVNQQISDKQDQVATLQTNLVQQMSQADALMASLQQQATYFNNMWTAIQAAQTGKVG